MDFKDLGHVVLLSFFSLLVLFILTKLMGKRQMSQMSLFDYIVGISIGSLAAEMASHPDEESWLGLASMVIYAGVAILINVWDDKSRKVRHFVQGDPLILFDHGTLYYNNLKKAKMDLNEFMTECRNSGYFDLALLQLIVMESNGKLSFLPNEMNRPLTPADMQMQPKQSRPVVAVITDGVVLPERLKATGNTESWLYKQMESQGFKDPSDIFLATVDADNALAIYEKNEDRVEKRYYA